EICTGLEFRRVLFRSACGRCHGCHMSTAGTHPDLCLVEPAEAGKMIRIDQIRELVDFAGRTPLYGGYRVALIMPAQAMNRAAQKVRKGAVSGSADTTT